jgi:hypothetical protein
VGNAFSPFHTHIDRALHHRYHPFPPTPTLSPHIEFCLQSLVFSDGDGAHTHKHRTAQPPSSPLSLLSSHIAFSYAQASCLAMPRLTPSSPTHIAH